MPKQKDKNIKEIQIIEIENNIFHLSLNNKNFRRLIIFRDIKNLFSLIRIHNKEKAEQVNVNIIIYSENKYENPKELFWRSALKVNDLYYKQYLSFFSLKNKTTNINVSLNLSIFWNSKIIKLLDIKTKQRILESIRLTTFVRNLIDVPSDVLTPTNFVKLVQWFIQKYLPRINNNITLEILGEKELIKLHFDSMLSVSRGSNEEAKVLILKYFGDKKKNKTYGLAGKGITYDSGGMNIKIHDYMRDMKLDMSGAATSVAMLIYAAINELPINLISVSGLCENMVSNKSYRPGDIIKTKSKKTVEIDNTDAEGRMVLIDLIEFLQTDLNITNIFTFATLTGQVRRFLNSIALPILSNSDKIISIVTKLKNKNNYGNLNLCVLPFDERYRKSMLSNTLADIRNCGTISSTISAGMFLHFFTNKNVKFTHFDIANVAFDGKKHLSNNSHYDLMFKMLKKLSEDEQ